MRNFIVQLYQPRGTVVTFSVLARSAQAAEKLVKKKRKKVYDKVNCIATYEGALTQEQIHEKLKYNNREQIIRG